MTRYIFHIELNSDNEKLATLPYKAVEQVMHAAIAGSEDNMLDTLQVKLLQVLESTTDVSSEVSAPVDDSLSYDWLNDDQKAAWDIAQRWLADDRPEAAYMVLRGYPGTGKSSWCRYFVENVHDHEIVPTALTNEAAFNLATLTKVPAKTIYSALGIRMVADEDKMVLDFGDNVPYYSKGTVMIVDEASMVNIEMRRFIHKAVKRLKLKILYIGDPAQLNPIGETHTSVWKMALPEYKFTLKKVERFDNQILKLSLAIRQCLINKDYNSPIVDDHDENEGVWKYDTKKEWFKQLMELKSPDDFVDKRVIAWRNKTVDLYNRKIRDNLGFTDPYSVGDRIVLRKPLEIDGQIIAYINEKFVIQDVKTGRLRADEEYLDVWRLHVEGIKNSLVLNIAQDEGLLAHILAGMATRARNSKGAQRSYNWKDFWSTEKQFSKVKFAYAGTVHLAQGSTLNTVFLDQTDILLNKISTEAFRALMVGSTRATTKLFTY